MITNIYIYQDFLPPSSSDLLLFVSSSAYFHDEGRTFRPVYGISANSASWPIWLGRPTDL